MFGRMSSLFVTDEAFVVSHILCSFSGREIDPVHIHGVGVPGRSGIPCCLGWKDIAISSAPELSEPYHISVELSCLIEPLFPLPASLVLSPREGSSMLHGLRNQGFLAAHTQV